MNTKTKGNLSRVQLMQRLLAHKTLSNTSQSVLFNEEEYEELDQILSDFQYILNNLFMYENSLKNDQYGGLVDVMKDIKDRGMY